MSEPLLTLRPATAERHGLRCRSAASLIELLVVLFIMGIMMGLLFPALQRARNRAQDMVCQSNVRQLNFALAHFISSKKLFPEPHRWTFEVLPYMEQWPLYNAMKNGFSPDADLPRPPLMRCPFQDDLDSRVAGIRICHQVLVVDRTPEGKPISSWLIMDRSILTGDEPEDPWYVGPEITWLARDRMVGNDPGPHPGGLYMTERGLIPN